MAKDNPDHIVVEEADRQGHRGRLQRVRLSCGRRVAYVPPSTSVSRSANEPRKPKVAPPGLLTSALSERFWPVAAQRSQDRIARPERCEASRGLASLWCAFEARESRSPLRQRPLSRSSDTRLRGPRLVPSRSTPSWAGDSGRPGTVANETTTETRALVVGPDSDVRVKAEGIRSWGSDQSDCGRWGARRTG